MRQAMRCGWILALAFGLVSSCTEYGNTLKGDLNHDGHLTSADLDLLQSMIDEGDADEAGDLNDDGKVDERDLDLLESWVCQANGAQVDADGNCCVESADGTVCCDRDFNGDFEDCEAPDTDCTSADDCSDLNCPADCVEGKCVCNGTCVSDEDCIMLNCPAFCNQNGLCECKVPCQDDDDCAFISKCQSVCGDEGYCVCDGDCLAEGEEFIGDPADFTCCEGLEPLERIDYIDGQCAHLDCECYVCAACGNNQCGPGENPCNCPADCGECIPGDERLHTCPDGSQVPWCTCTDNAAWECIRSPENQCTADCRGAGEHFTDYDGTERCCPGLTRADDCTPVLQDGQVTCECFDCPCFVCVACGDGVCDDGENYCTCPEDCPPPACQPGDIRYYDCPDGTQVPECECDQDGQWVCIGNPWWQCEGDCHPAGARFEGEGRCCEGLTKAEDAVFGGMHNGEPVCQLACDWQGSECWICLPCGDGFCSQNENPCTCPEDCPLPACEPGETRPCECNNNLAQDPPCFECGQDGQWYPIEYAADPCLCFANQFGCRETYVCDQHTGICEPDCRLLDFACGEGERCDEETGLCVPDECVAEGDGFEGEPVDGICCPGLVPVPELYPENGYCTGPNCVCWICTACGDGQCGVGENRCNCPADCVGWEDCMSQACSQVAGRYAVGGDCPGVPGSGDTQMHPVAQEGCQVIFATPDGADPLLQELLGATGCIDHNVIYTQNDCAGMAFQTGASTTMHFECPFTDDDGNQGSCIVFLDDLID